MQDKNLDSFCHRHVSVSYTLISCHLPTLWWPHSWLQCKREFIEQVSESPVSSAFVAAAGYRFVFSGPLFVDGGGYFVLIDAYRWSFLASGKGLIEKKNEDCSGCCRVGYRK